MFALSLFSIRSFNLYSFRVNGNQVADIFQLLVTWCRFNIPAEKKVPNKRQVKASHNLISFVICPLSSIAAKTHSLVRERLLFIWASCGRPDVCGWENSWRFASRKASCLSRRIWAPTTHQHLSLSPFHLIPSPHLWPPLCEGGQSRQTGLLHNNVHERNSYQAQSKHLSHSLKIDGSENHWAYLSSLLTLCFTSQKICHD